MFKFGTKAETLNRLSNEVTKCIIPQCDYMYVSDWIGFSQPILDSISEHFQGLIAVRSSTTLEDRQDLSGAGRYTSILDIDSQNHSLLRAAINNVLSSYPNDTGNQVLIQKMVPSVMLSGVVMTHNLDNGAPYYVFNYDDESGRPDSITGGTIISKTVMLYREALFEAIKSERIKIIYNGIRELEEICGNQPLDIEFCLTEDMQLFVLQVRPISVQHKWSVNIHKKVSDELKKVAILHRRINQKTAGILGGYTILGNMPDWNPAEIIGTKPRPLSFSLYRYLITHDTWAKARTSMGYRDMKHHELMLVLAGIPILMYAPVSTAFCLIQHQISLMRNWLITG